MISVLQKLKEKKVLDTSRSIGKFSRRDTCRFCQRHNLIEILDLGNVPLAGGFIKENDFAEEKYYPLTLDFCLFYVLAKSEYRYGVVIW